MKSWFVALILVLFGNIAYALTGSFFQNDREYGLTEKLYSVSDIGNIVLPENCTLVPCAEAIKYADNLTYPVDYLICSNGIVDTHLKKKCSIVTISGKSYVECNGSFLPQNKKFRAFASCPITSQNETNGTVQEAAYLDFKPDPNAYYCSKDMNGNGFFDKQEEIQRCLLSDDKKGYVCPIDKVACKATYEKPICPQGSLNEEKHVCQADAVIKCPSGYKWDSSLDLCVLTPVCPDGGTFNPNTDRCEKKVINECPSGYSYDKSRDLCYRQVVCPSGTSYNPSRDRCERVPKFECPKGYFYNPSTQKCEMKPVCPSGTKYNPQRNRCEKELAKCPTGYTYNAVLDRCVKNVECPDGGVLNPNTDKCELRATPDCPSGWSYNSSTGKCERAPSCPNGGTYSKDYNVCLAPISGVNCPSGYTYSSTYKACIKAPYCPSGSHYNKSTDRCERSPNHSCPSGWSYNSSTGKCERAPSCSSGMSYSKSLNKCIAYAKTTCPDGYTYNSSRKRCEAKPICPKGFTYNANTNRCEVGAATNYECSLTGKTYPNLSACQASCQKNGSCSEGKKSLCIVGYTIACLGTTPAFFWSNFSPSSPVGQALISTGACFTYDGDVACSLSILSVLPECPGESVDGDAFLLCSDAGNFFIGGALDLHFSTSYTCSLNGQSYSNLSSCQANCKAAGTCSQIGNCPSGSTLSGGLCIANPSCPDGGIFDGVHDVCYKAPYHSCSQGTYDSASGYCVSSASCSGGTLNTARDVCERSPATYCPDGFTLSGKVCYTAATCSSGALDTGIDYCKASPKFTCPSGYTYSSTYGKCFSNADCGDGYLNGKADKCQLAYTLKCPSGYVLNENKCQKSPSCPSPGKYNSAINKCDAGNNLCGSLKFDGKYDVCYVSAECGVGNLNPSRDLCEAPVSKIECFGYKYDSSAKVCYTDEDYCGSFSYDSAHNQCVAKVSKNCGSYVLAPDNPQLCVKQITCPKDSEYSLNNTIRYSKVLDRCISDAVHECPKGQTYVYTWSKEDLKCELVPICKEGVFTPETNGCYKGDFTCPVGNYPCLPINGKNYCSPNSCSKWDNATEYDDTPEGANDKKNDGQIDKNGNCLGTIYIFNGNDYRCRPPGLQTGGSNCCKKSTTWFGLGQCKERERILAKLRSWGKLDGQCHYVGSYCAMKVLKICVQKKKTYCCFHSVLARIVQEQGRKQLGISWGSPKSPNCRGFTPEEFQRLDFSKMDFSEWYEDIQKRIRENFGVFKSEVPKKVKSYYENLQKY